MVSVAHLPGDFTGSDDISGGGGRTAFSIFCGDWKLLLLTLPSSLPGENLPLHFTKQRAQTCVCVFEKNLWG